MEYKTIDDLGDLNGKQSRYAARRFERPDG